jgi:hypothetical protein
MRTSLSEIKAIEDHIFGYTDTGDSLLFEANMLLNANLRQNATQQKAAYQIVTQYSRRQLRAELQTVHQKLMDRPDSFMQKLLGLFNGK